MRLVKSLLSLVVFAGIAFLGWAWWFATSPLRLATSPLEFEIEPGMSLRIASQQMTGAGLGFAPLEFTLLGRLLGRAADIKAGSYEVEQGVTPLQLLDKLTRGDVTQSEIVFVEGKTFRQIRAALDAQPDLRHDSAGLPDAEVLARIGATETRPEGLFFPDTYLFAKQSGDLRVLRRAYLAMQSKLASEWEKRDPSVPYASPYEALIMASIVEKETGAPDERPLIASVFLNRLRIDMPLQTDPSVIYGLGERYDGNIHKTDLQADTPYNTYTRRGLPPTPIALPSEESIQAVLHPATSKALYFVAKGGGRHQFSDTLEEHNRAVYRYQIKGGA